MEQNIKSSRLYENGEQNIRSGPVSKQKLPPLSSPVNLGAQRFLMLEQKVADMEKTLELMREMLNANNETLQAIMDAVNAEKANS